ncbi:MAG TPA: O-antigen ligase family protein [Pirellulales bacterium]|nr:O-antigen ligase family protein [Pirellulales bacterium]
MNRHRKSPDRSHADRSQPLRPANSSGGSVSRSVLLAAVVALFVARPLLPSEGPVTAEGEGLQFVLLALVLACAWLLVGLWQDHLRVRIGWVDAGWLALVVCLALSAFAASEHRSARPAINVFWEWVALGLGFFLTRQLIETQREARAAVAVMLALAATLSAYGLHEYFVSKPETKRQYEQNPEKVLRELGIPAEKNSPARMRFEDRLRSTEPMATFGLANSLAGVLAPWFVVAAGLALFPNRRDAGTDRRVRFYQAALFLLAGLMAACLLLTKSRSAWIASGLGFAGLAGWALLQGRWLSRRMLFAGLGLFALLVAAAVLAGGLDREVLTEAAKSLGYRWQYWQSSLAMIADHPLAGCGPGNFQDEYTRYKLPDASEVVADPHNLLFEVWATAGTPALLAFLGIFAGAACDLWRWRTSRPSPTRPSNSRTDFQSVADRVTDQRSVLRQGVAPVEPEASLRWILVGGALAGFALAYIVGLSATVPLSDKAFAGGLAVMSVALALLYPWIDRGVLPAGLPLLGAVVLAVNLLAAGGIGFPGVAGSLWLLLGLGLSLAGADIPRRSLSKAGSACAVSAMLLVLGTFVWGDYLPVMNARLSLLQAEASQISLAERQAKLKAAAAADPLWEKPWRELAALEFGRWRRQNDRTALEQWEQAIEETNRRRPHSAKLREESGYGYLKVYEHDGRKTDLQKAIAGYEQAAELYPNHAETRGKLALALAAGGREKRAREQADLALELDRSTPHADQKLSPELRADVQTIARGPARGAE